MGKYVKHTSEFVEEQVYKNKHSCADNLRRTFMLNIFKKWKNDDFVEGKELQCAELSGFPILS